MANNYKSASISVTTSATQISPGWDIESLSVLPTDGDISVRLKNKNGWGDWIPVVEDVALNIEVECFRVEIKSQSGTVAVDYFLKGDK